LTIQFLRRFLHGFIDSEEFKICITLYYPEISHFRSEFLVNSYRNLRYRFDYLWRLFYSDEFGRAFDRYAQNYKNIIDDTRLDDDFGAQRLADSARRIFRDNSENGNSLAYALLMQSNLNLSLEVDFLEWLTFSKSVRLDLNQMPSLLFNSLVDEFCISNNRYPDDRAKLISAFRQTNPASLANKLASVLSKSQLKRMKSLGYIYDRYSNQNIPYRCIILPLAANSESYKSFIQKYWMDLNSLSADYLDIFYSENDFGQTGYDIKRKIQSLPKNLSNDLPCLVIWEHSMSDAVAIDLQGLENEEIFRVISSIVDFIKVKSPFNVMSERVRNVAQKFREKNRPITNYINQVENNSGIVAGTISGGIITMNTHSAVDLNDFAKDLQEAMALIKQYVAFSELQKNELIEIFSSAKRAIESNSLGEQNQSKERFKYFMLGAGNAIKDLLTVLSSCASLATFFNITLP